MTIKRKMIKPCQCGLATAVFLIFFLCAAAWAAKIDDGRSSTSPVSSRKTSVEKSSSSDSQGKVVIEAPANASAADAPSKSAVESEKTDSSVTTDAGEPGPAKAKKNVTVKKKRPESPSKKAAEKFVTLDFDNVNIEVFVKFISELTGKNFIIDEKVKGKVTIYSPKKIPLSDVYKVFLSVLEINGYATVPVGDMVKIIPSADARQKKR